MAELLSIHQVELKPGTSEEFISVVYNEMAPFYAKLCWGVRLLKGDRGERDGKYVMILDIPSPKDRDRWVPEPDVFSAEAEILFETSGPVWEKLERLATQVFDPNFTDYVLVPNLPEVKD